MSAWFEEKNDSIVLSVRVIPRASKDAIAEVIGGEALKIRIQAPPVDGRANACLIKFLSKHWNIPRSNIEIIAGETGRNKRLRISKPTDEIRKELLSLVTD
jgi:uncharacterized protein (TIGR00251 family)